MFTRTNFDLYICFNHFQSILIRLNLVYNKNVHNVNLMYTLLETLLSLYFTVLCNASGTYASIYVLLNSWVSPAFNKRTFMQLIHPSAFTMKQGNIITLYNTTVSSMNKVSYFLILIILVNCPTGMAGKSKALNIQS